jgi:hypothetical protein
VWHVRLQFLANESLSQFGRSLGVVKSEATLELQQREAVIADLRQVLWLMGWVVVGGCGGWGDRSCWMLLHCVIGRRPTSAFVREPTISQDLEQCRATLASREEAIDSIQEVRG